MNHNEAYDQLESYVLGALTPEEQQAVDEHLATNCAECLARVRELEEIVVDLARNVPQQEPPAHLRAQILGSLGAGAKTMHRPRRFNIGWLAAGVAAAAAFVLLFKSFSQQDQITKLEHALKEAQDVSNILETPGMQFVDLKGVEPNTQSFGKVVVDPKQGNAVVYMYRLPQVPKGMEYQLWVMRDGKPTSAGVFTVNEDGSAMLTLKDMPDDDQQPAFLVTIEPEGGQPAPTGMMYLTGPGPITPSNP